MSQGEPPPGNGDPMEQLRELLVGPERKDLADLRRIVTDPAEKARALSELLPHAIRVSTARDAKLSESLAPTIESALKESVRKDPSVLTDVVFPIIGPAIRRAIADAFSKMVQAVNQTMEHSLSVQGFKWRLEAKRTGKSFAEVVLARTLIYRVEQVFLIHKETGLLLNHAQVPDAAAQDADMVSGMLTAIQDFMRDAFQAEGDGLRATQYGDYHVWLESSRQTTVAAFIRGIAPEDVRSTLQDALNRISIDHSAALKNFRGDAAPFEEARAALEECLRVQLAERARRHSPMLWIAPLLLVLALLGLWEWSYLRQVEQRVADTRQQVEERARRHAIHREQRDGTARRQEAAVIEEARILKCVDQLNAGEGLVVTGFSRHDGALHLTGLRDPLAADPRPIIASAGLAPAAVVTHWEPFYSLDPGIIVKRAAQRLSPPPSVTLAMQGETLVATGSAPGSWIATAAARAQNILGVVAFDDSAVADETMDALVAKKKAIEQTVIFFGNGSELDAEQAAKVREVAAQIAAFQDIAKKSGRRARVTVVGHTNDSGTEALNLKLSHARAENVARTLAGEGLDPATLTVVGTGPRERLFQAEEDFAKNRNVNFQAEIQEATPNPPPR